MNSHQKAPEVTIIILNHNGIRETRQCLSSVLATRYPRLKIILGDNGSRENEVKALTREFKDKRIKFVRFKKNWGFAGGNNRLLKKTRSKYVVFLNNDTLVDPFWLTPLVKVAEKDSRVAVCQPKIKSLLQKKLFDYAGAAGGFLDIFGYPFARGRLFFTLEKDQGQYNNQCEIFWASGTAMFLRRSVLERIGVFDENFFAYAEEVDLCWRIHKIGLKVVYVPQSDIYHLGGATSNRNLSQKIFLVHRNHLLLLLKHYPLKDLLIRFPPRILLDIASLFFYLGKGKVKLIFSVALAYLSLLFNLKKILKARKSNVKETDASYKRLLYKKSLVFDYFILRKKIFTDLDFL